MKFTGLTYYGVRYKGSMWVGKQYVSYCFIRQPSEGLFVKHPLVAKVWADTAKLKTIMKKSRYKQDIQTVDWSDYELVNMHTGEAQPLSVILEA